MRRWEIGVLVPKDVRAIPPGVVLAILGAFVLCVGPLDYFLLGFWKCRQWTWVVFPCVSLGFTVLAVKVSQHYLGTADHRNSMTFLDVDDSGGVVRANRFEVVFASGRRRIRSEVANAVTAPVRLQSSGQRAGAEVLRGRFPERYALEFPVHQWKAECCRFLMIGGNAPHRIDWSGEQPACAGTEIEVAHRFSGGGHETLWGRSALSVDMLKEASVAPATRDGGSTARRKLSSLITAISPAGGGGFEDLPVFDPGNPSHSLLVAVIREGKNYFIYRKRERR